MGGIFRGCGRRRRLFHRVPHPRAVPPVHLTRETARHVAAALGLGPVLVGDVLASGVSKGRLRSAVAAGTLRKVRHGVVQVVELEAPVPVDDPYAVDRDRAAATLASMGDEAMLGHATAQMLWQLPALRPGPVDRDIWVVSSRHGEVQRGVHLRIGEVSDEDRAVVDGLRCTSLPRTAIDVARFRPLPEALVVLDAALRQVTISDLRDALDRHPMSYGRRGLEEALRESDARSESPLESASRGLMVVARLPRPLLQRTVWAEGRAYRLDFLWDDAKVAGEADGWGKLQSVDDLRAEKVREDALRRRGLHVVRWTSDEVWRRPDAFVQRLRTALTAS